MFPLFLENFMGLRNREAGTMNEDKINEKYICSSEKPNVYISYEPQYRSLPQIFNRLLTRAYV